MATVNIAYGTSTSITCTLSSLSSSTTAWRSCSAIDNGTNKFDDAMLYIAVKTSASALANDKACYVYLYGSEDGTNYNVSTAEMGSPGTDAAFTYDGVATNLKGPVALSATATSTTYKCVIGSVASFFGGRMPRKWGFVLQNYTGQNLDSTEGNHAKTYTGITYTVA